MKIRTHPRPTLSHLPYTSVHIHIHSRPYPFTSVLRSHTSLFYNPYTVYEHKVSYTYQQQAQIRRIDRLM